MKREVYVLVVILLAALVAAAPGVTLTSPVDGNVSSETTVTFQCAISESGTISSVKLYTNQSGSWAQTGSTISADVTAANFTVASMSTGNYLWNCLAENSLGETAWASSNSTVSVSSLAFLSGVPNQSISEDSNASEVFDLDTYFGGATRYSVTGNDSIVVTVGTDNTVSFFPAANFSGAENMTFTATDGVASLASNLVLVNVTESNDPPFVVKNISDQVMEVGGALLLDMDDYFDDHENDDLNYTTDSSEFFLEENGGEKITLTTSEDDWKGEANVTITASDGSLSATSTFLLTVGSEFNSKPSIISFLPSDTEPHIELSQSQSFSVNVVDLDGDGLSFTWYVDSVDQELNESTFTFATETDGVYTIEVAVIDPFSETRQSWTVVVGDAVLEDMPVSSEDAVCGNGIVEEGEDCNTCSLDAGCGGEYTCTKGICVEDTRRSSQGIFRFFILVLLTLGIGGLFYYLFVLRKVKEVEEEHKPFKFQQWDKEEE